MVSTPETLSAAFGRFELATVARVRVHDPAPAAASHGAAMAHNQPTREACQPLVLSALTFSGGSVEDLAGGILNNGILTMTGVRIVGHSGLDDEPASICERIFLLRVKSGATVDAFSLFRRAQSPPNRQSNAAKQFTRDVIDTLGDRVNEVVDKYRSGIETNL